MLEMLEIDGFLDEIVSTVANSGDSLGDSTERRHDDDGDTGIGLDGAGKNVHAGAVGKLEIGEDGGETLARDGDKRFGGISGGEDGVPHPLKSGGEHLAELGFVFDEKDGVHTEFTI